ncbi:MAG TPA: hypothetical protein VE174_13820 [Actinomycetota bacterium]|nr:hypothetical protein [Actinomycetota bacterium]
MASPALARTAEEPVADGEVAPASIAVDSFVEAAYTNNLLEGRVFVTEVNESNRMCAAFRRVNLVQSTKTKRGWKNKVAGWDASTATGAFKFRVSKGFWTVKVPAHSYENNDGTEVQCKAVKLTKRIKVS